MAFILGFANNETDRVLIGDGTGVSLKLGKIVGTTITNLFTFADSGVLTVASGITLSAFNTAGVVHNTSGGVFTTSLVVDADIAVAAAIAVAKLSAGGTANRVILTTDGTNVTWGRVDLTAMVTGTLPVGNLPVSGGGSSVVGVGRQLTATAPITIDGLSTNVDLSANRTIAVLNATTGAIGVVQLAKDLAGTATSVQVAKVKGTSVTTAGGSLTTGQVLRVTGVSAADWGALDLANASAVTGTLPVGNLPVSGGGSSVVGVGRTLTGTAPITVDGDNAAHDFSTNHTIAVSNATVSNVGVLRLANDFAGTATAPTVIQLTGAAGVVSILASTLTWNANVSPVVGQAQATVGTGLTFQFYAQQGHAGSRGGTLLMGGGPGGTSGTNLAGDVQFDLGASVSNASAHITAFSGSFTVLDVQRTALNTVTIDTGPLATFDFAKAVGVLVDAGTGGGPNSGEYSLAVGNNAGKDKVFLAVGGGQPAGDSTPRYYVNIATGSNDVTSGTPVSALATVHIGQQTFNSITGGTRSAGKIAALLIDGAPVLSGAFWDGTQASYSLYVAGGVARFDGGVQFSSNSFLLGSVGSAPMFVDSSGQVFLGDGSHVVQINAAGGFNFNGIGTSTSASSGAGFALPGNPEFYAIVKVNNVSYKMALWNI